MTIDTRPHLPEQDGNSASLGFELRNKALSEVLDSYMQTSDMGRSMAAPLQAAVKEKPETKGSSGGQPQFVSSDLPGAPAENKEATPPKAPADRQPEALPGTQPKPGNLEVSNPLVLLEQAQANHAQVGGLNDAIKAQFSAAIRQADRLVASYASPAIEMKALEKEVEKVVDKDLEAKIKKLTDERDALVRKLQTEHPESTKQLQELDSKWGAAKTEAERKQIEESMAKVPFAADLINKQRELTNQESQPTHMRLLELQTKMGALKNLVESPVLTRFGMAYALSEDAARAEKTAKEFKGLTAQQIESLKKLAEENRAQARTLLEQVIKLDPNARFDAFFVKLAKDVNFKIPEGKDNKAKEAQDGQKSPFAEITKGGHPILILHEAHTSVKDKGLEASRHLFEKAIAVADKLDQKSISQRLEYFTAAANDPNLNKDVRLQAMSMAMEYTGLQHSPFIARFQYAIELHNGAVEKKAGGDSKLAAELLAQAEKLEPEEAKSELFKLVKERIEKGQKITDQDLNPAKAQNEWGAKLDETTKEISKAISQYVDADKMQNAVTAEKALREAVKAADSLDIEGLKKQAQTIKAEIAKLGNTPEDLAKGRELLFLSKNVDKLIDLPVELRLEQAKFYVRNHKPDEAKAVLEDKAFLAKYPEMQKRADYKAIKGFVDEYCKSSLEKAIDWLKRESKGVISDFGSGGIAALVFALNPEGGLGRRLVMAVAAGAVAKPALQFAMGETPKWSDSAWGAVNATMFIAGGAAHKRLTQSMLAGVDETLLKEQLLKAGVKETVIQEFALQQDLRQVEAISALLKTQLGENAEGRILRIEAERLGVSAAVAKQLDGTSGKAAVELFTQLLKTKAGTALNSVALTEAAANLGLSQAALREIATARKGEALAAVESVLRAHITDQRKAAGEALSMAKQYRRQGMFEESAAMMDAYKQLSADASANAGTRIFGVNPRLFDARNVLGGGMSPFGFRDVNSFANLNDLVARSYWNRYKVDASSIALMSLMYRGAHNAYNVYVPDERTGKKLTPYEATANTLRGAVEDGIAGGFFLPGLRAIAGPNPASLAERLAPARPPSGLLAPLQAPGYYLGRSVVGPLVRTIPAPLLASAELFSSTLERTIPSAAVLSAQLRLIREENDKLLENKNMPADDDDFDLDELDLYKQDRKKLEDILGELQKKKEGGK